MSDCILSFFLWGCQGGVVFFLFTLCVCVDALF